MTSDGFQTIKHGSNNFVMFQNNFSLNILQDLPAWEMGFKSESQGHILGRCGAGVVGISLSGVVVQRGRGVTFL